MAGPTPTLMRQIQVGFAEESSYGTRDDTKVIVRPVVRSLEVTPTQERQNIGRTGSIDASRTFFATQTYDFSMTMEADPHMAMWFLKWALGRAFDISANNFRLVPLPLNQEVLSFTTYLDTQQSDFVRTNNRTIEMLGGVIETLAMRSAGTEADKTITFELSGSMQQPKTSSTFPYPMEAGALILPAEHPTIGTGNVDIIPYIHQNLGSSVGSPSGFNHELLGYTFTINNSLKMNTYPDGDNEPFISDIIYTGRNIQMEWTAEYKDMTEYHTFHDARKVTDFQFQGEHRLEYASGEQYRFDIYMPSVAISQASQLISTGDAEETLEQTYTADLINRAEIVENTATTETDVDFAFADADARAALQFTANPRNYATPASTHPKGHLSFVEITFTKTADLASSDLFMDIYTDSSNTPGDLLSTSQVVKTDWISRHVVNFIFDNPPILTPGTSYWMVLRTTSTSAIPAADLKIRGAATGGTSQASADAGTNWAGSAGTVDWSYKIGYNGFPVVIELETDADLTP